MAELSQTERQDWLAALAVQWRRAPDALPDLREGVSRDSRDLVSQELREVARGCRLPLAASIQKQLGPFDPEHLRALLEVPRERFVRADDVERSAEDTPLPLDDQGLSTISAPHAYVLSFRLAALAPGDALVELGSGSGYGAALAAFIVGPGGSVLTFEIDPSLAGWAGRTLADQPNAHVVCADAVSSAPRWGRAQKVICTFAVEALPEAWTAALPEGGRLVAPVGPRDEQRLVLVQRQRGAIVRTEHGAVRYVVNRSGR